MKKSKGKESRKKKEGKPFRKGKIGITGT